MQYATAWHCGDACGTVTTQRPLERYPTAVPTATGTMAAGNVRGRAPSTHTLAGVVTGDAAAAFDHTLEAWLAAARGPYTGTKRHKEGIVIRPLVEQRSESLGGSRMSFKVINSGIDYQFATLSSQIKAELGHAAALGPARSSGAKFLHAPSTQQYACVMDVTGDIEPAMVDSARYNGSPATIIALAHVGNQLGQAWVVGPSCSADNPDILKHVIQAVLPEALLDENTKYHINPTGRFVIGGPMGDTGLTGRKIIVDTYGGMGRHGGGAFSGKDPTKVDRSAAYMARYIAKNIVAAGLADRCEVQLAYAIGVAEPVSVLVDTFGTGKLESTKLQDLVRANFHLTPKGIIDHLKLRRPIYLATAAFGHFGRSGPGFSWEVTDKAETLKSAAAGHVTASV